jgi:hypothetical protein
VSPFRVRSEKQSNHGKNGNDGQKQNGIESETNEELPCLCDDALTISNKRQSSCGPIYSTLFTKQGFAPPSSKGKKSNDKLACLHRKNTQSRAKNFIHISKRKRRKFRPKNLDSPTSPTAQTSCETSPPWVRPRPCNNPGSGCARRSPGGIPRPGSSGPAASVR